MEGIDQLQVLPLCLFVSFFLFGATAPPQWARASSFMRFLDHTQRRTTVGGTPLDEWSARHKDLYLTTHNTHKRQASMSPVGFETTISAGERPRGQWDRLLPNYLRGNNPSSSRHFGKKKKYVQWSLHRAISRQVAVTVSLMPDILDTGTWAPDDGWRYHPKHVEQFTDINKLYIIASCWTIIDTKNMLPLPGL